MNWRSIVAALAVLAAAPSALAQSREELSFERAIRLGVGEVIKADGPVARGDVVLSFPYEYRRTGTLQNDVHGTGLFTQHTLYAAAGTPGFLVGEFASVSGARGSPVWCFQRPQTEEPQNLDRIVCFLGVWPLHFRRPPLLLRSFTIDPSSSLRSEAPIIEEGPAQLPFALRLEFRMRGWTRRFLELDLYVEGERINTFQAPRNPDGGAIFPSVAGDIRFVPQGDATIATPLAPGAGLPSTDIAGISEAFLRAGAVVESPLIGVAPPPLTGEYVAVGRNDEVMSQQVQTPAPLQISTAPNGNERFGGAGTLVYPAMRGPHLVYCRPPPPPPPGERMHRRLPRERWYCLEDSDRDGAFESLWDSVVYGDGAGVFVFSINGSPDRLRDPITITPAPDGERRQMALRLRYIGPLGDRRNEAGAVVATHAQFTWIAHENAGDMGGARDFRVALDENGEGRIVTPSGAVLGRVRNVDVSTGGAEILIEGGLPVGETTYLSGRRTQP